MRNACDCLGIVQVFYKDTHHVYRVDTLDSLEWLDHGFGTRHSDAWVPGPLVWVKQIHSATCVPADGTSGCLGEADALVSNTPGFYVSIRTADCIPILLADRRLRAVAAVHAGWRGTVQCISMKAVENMGNRFGTRPEDLIAAIGPGICGRCYEVGPEVATAFERWFPERSDLDGKTKVDLTEANRRQLLEAGLDPENVCTGAPCTMCNSGDFYSWRREQMRTGRMVSAIAVRA